MKYVIEYTLYYWESSEESSADVEQFIAGLRSEAYGTVSITYKVYELGRLISGGAQ